MCQGVRMMDDGEDVAQVVLEKSLIEETSDAAAAGPSYRHGDHPAGLSGPERPVLQIAESPVKKRRRGGVDDSQSGSRWVFEISPPLAENCRFKI